MCSLQGLGAASIPNVRCCRVRWVARVRVGVWCVAGRTAAVCARVRVCGCRARGVRAPVWCVCVRGCSGHLGCLWEVGRHGGLGQQLHKEQLEAIEI